MYEVLIAIDFGVTVIAIIGLADLFTNHIYLVASSEAQQVFARLGLALLILIALLKLVLVAVFLHKESRKLVK